MFFSFKRRPLIDTLTRRAMVLLAMLAVAACRAGLGGPTGEQVAVSQADAIFAAIKAKDFQHAASLYSDQFYRATTPQKWQAHLERINDKWGDLQSYELSNVVVNSVYSGVRFALKYKTEYAKRGAFETLVFFRRIDQDRINIITHRMEFLPRNM